MGQVRVGTASWTDRTLIASGWYPPEADTPEKRLRYYARQFALVEVDATYYALPAERTAMAWAARTPAGFTFNVKAFSLFTQHPTPVAALPKDLRPAAEKTGKDRVYLKDVDPAVTDQVWERFLGALGPLRAERKLGAILLQFPPWFPIGRARKDYIVACAERAAPDRVCIEFRNRTWMTPDNQEETLGFLERHRLPYVGVDMPQGHRDSIPPVLAATAPDLAVVRLHGHSDKWDSKDIHERFGYRYSDGELNQWAPRIRDLADRTATTHVLFNNCYRDYAQVNAQQLAALLSLGGPGGQDAEAGPRAEGQAAQAGGGLDLEPGRHRRDLLEVALHVRVGDHAGDDREQVEQAEHDADGHRGVPDGGSGTEAEQGDQGEVEDRPGGGAQHRPVGQGQRREAVGPGEAMAGQDEPPGQQRSQDGEGPSDQHQAGEEDRLGGQDG